MNYFEEKVCNAILRKLAPDMYNALRSADTIPSMNINSDRLTIPLVAEAKLIHNKRLGQFITHVRAMGPVDKQFFISEQVFSNSASEPL